MTETNFHATWVGRCDPADGYIISYSQPGSSVPFSSVPTGTRSTPSDAPVANTLRFVLAYSTTQSPDPNAHRSSAMPGTPPARGRLIILGYQPGQTFPLEPFTLVSKWIQIIASHNHTVKDVEDVASLVSDGRVKPIISDRYAMEEANGALDKLRQEDPVGRIVLEL